MHSDADLAAAKAAIRSDLRQRRARLDNAAIRQASAAVVGRLRGLRIVTTAQHIAAYRAVRGEISLDGLLEVTRQTTGVTDGVSFTLPRVNGDRIEFVLWQADQDCVPGSFGIPEPRADVILEPDNHDVILVPLVAFDSAGFRVGQGGGFYDRALGGLRRFAPSQPNTRSLKPRLIGVAHWFQQIAAVPRESHDVALDMVLTDRSAFEITPGVTDL